MRRFVMEWALQRVGARQVMIVPPNVDDRANLERRLKQLIEFPPVVRAEKHNWGGEWTGAYASEDPLLSSKDGVAGLDEVDQDSMRRFGYGYIAYVELK